MGIWEVLTDLAEAAVPWSNAEAEAPAPAEDEKVRCVGLFPRGYRSRSLALKQNGNFRLSKSAAISQSALVAGSFRSQDETPLTGFIG